MSESVLRVGQIEDVESSTDALNPDVSLALTGSLLSAVVGLVVVFEVTHYMIPSILRDLNEGSESLAPTMM